MILLTDQRHSAELCAWAAARIPHVGDAGFGPAWGVGVSVVPGEVAAVVVYHDWVPAFGTLQLSIASDSPRWVNRGAIGRVLGLAFDQPWSGRRINKVWTAVPSDARRVLAFNAICGFRREATLRHHFGRGRHAVIASMMRGEFNAKFRPVGVPYAPGAALVA